MDVLSEVLRAVRLTGALFFDISARAPWGIGSPPTAEVRNRVMPSSAHLMAFHCVMEGSGFIKMRDFDMPALPITAGDVILLPHGDAHFLSSEAGNHVAPDLDLFRLPTDHMLPFRIMEDGTGPAVRMLCGYFGCDNFPFNPLLEALDRVTIIQAGPDCGKLASTFIAAALNEGSYERPGGELVIAKLSELMLIQALRIHIDTLPVDSGGWLSGLRDPAIARALLLLHGAPARDWTLDSLARAVGLSRSVLSERFARFIGLPAMTYLARWRMQLASHALVEHHASIAGIAADVGYESEAAFNRAFKKIVGVPPGQWRRSRQDAA